MITRLDHVALMVRDLDAAIKNVGEHLGLSVEKTSYVPSFHCRIAFIPCGNVMLELVQPTAPGSGTQWLKRHGEGLHHLCFAVDDLDSAYHQAQRDGTARSDGIRLGGEGKNVFFLENGLMLNSVIEFVQEDSEC